MMEKLEIEVLSQATNMGVVQMPGRRFPGLVVQGDSMSSLLDLAESIYSRVKHTPDEEFVGEIEQLIKLLQTHLCHYEQVLNEHNLKLLYSSKSTRPQFIFGKLSE